MPDEKETRSAPLGLRLLPSVKAALEEAAKADRRSIASYVERLIVADLENSGYLPKGAAE